MASKKFFYLKICSLVILFTGLVSIYIFNDISRDKKRLLLGQSMLISGDLKGASECFNALSRSWWVGNPARLGKILIKIINGQEHHQDVLPEKSKIKISDFNLPILLSKQLASTEYEKCLELSKIGIYYGENKSRLFYPASLLELGKIDEARDEFSKLDTLQKSSDMGQRLRKTLKHMKPGIKQIVMDRNGHIVGTVNNRKRFEFAKDDLSLLIQHQFIKEVLKQRNTGGIRLSLDLELSRMAKKSLGNHRGSIVLILIKTGEILAAVSDELTKEEMGPESSPAFEQMLEPASIAKLITTTAAFRAGLNPDKEISSIICRGAKRYKGGILYCASSKERNEGLVPAMATSCNISFADLGIKIGWKSLIEEQKRFGFDRVRENTFPFGRILINNGNDRMLANLSIGLENTVTNTVHAAMIAAVFGSRGEMKEPVLIWGCDGLLGYSPQSFKRPKPVRIIKREWIPLIHRSMKAVTEYGGTAEGIAPYDFPVAMKTGTGGSYRNGFHINYIGYAPADQPLVAFCVRVTHQRRSSTARRNGYETNYRMLQGLRQKKSLFYHSSIIIPH
jgi:hypothetical protein